MFNSKNGISVSSSKNLFKDGKWLFRSHVDSQLIVLLAEEKNMVTEDKGHHLVKFKHGMDTPDEKSSEGTEFLEILNKDLTVELPQVMMLAEQSEEIIQVQFLRVFRRFFKFPVSFLYYLVCNHLVYLYWMGQADKRDIVCYTESVESLPKLCR